MSAIDWAGLLATLEQKRAALDDERADIDAVIETIRRRASLTVPAGLQRAPAPNGVKTVKPTPRTGKTAPIDPADLAPIRKLYEDGATVTAIAKKLGKSTSVIYGYASRFHWKRPPGQGVQTAAKPKGEQLKGSVRCPKCNSMTDYDPCRFCGEKLKRPW